MREKITPYLREKISQAAFSFQYQIKNGSVETETYSDPLNEDSHEVTKGLIHKYDNRALIKVSYQCAAHCRFCTRIRQIGNLEGTLNEADIEHIVNYLVANPQIDEVILSGGDPFYTPKITLAVLNSLKQLPQLKIFRIGSRLPMQLPSAFTDGKLDELLELIDEIGKEKPFFVLIHINHPGELTPEAIKAIQKLRQYRITLLSQTVFLKGLNDEIEVLESLFRQIYHLGIIPYYIYHCDAVKGLEPFVADLEKEIEIVTALHTKLSGIACPKHVIDIENGYGKLTLPQNFIQPNLDVTTDYKGNSYLLNTAISPLV